MRLSANFFVFWIVRRPVLFHAHLCGRMAISLLPCRSRLRAT
jgi:hypothetical protein